LRDKPNVCCILLLGFVLESVGFDVEMSNYLEAIYGRDLVDPEKGWNRIHNFVQLRLDSLVASLPAWATSELTFQVQIFKDKIFNGISGGRARGVRVAVLFT
jgi:hypothetical protein